MQYKQVLKDGNALETIVEAIEDDLHPNVAVIVDQIQALARV